MMQEEIREQINIELGQVSAIFMSKATDLVMPTEELQESSERLMGIINTALQAERDEILESVKEIVYVKAVEKFNSTPQIGEKFDIEKHNHANKMLNEMNVFIGESIINLINNK